MDRNVYYKVYKLFGTLVALRKESVDRNIYVSHELPFDRWSLSARRAWIEILACSSGVSECAGRSPQGERG